MIYVFSACEDTCVQMLIEKIENISRNFQDDIQIVIPKRLEPLWNMLQNVNESYHSVERMYNSYKTSIQQIVLYGESVEEELRRKVKNSKIKVGRIRVFGIFAAPMKRFF